MSETLHFLQSFGWLGALGVNLLIGWAAWSLTKKFMTREDCSAQRAEIVQANERFARLLAAHEASMRELTLRLEAIPGQDRLHDIELRLVRIEGEQSRQSEEIRGLRDILERVENQTTLLMRDRMERK